MGSVHLNTKGEIYMYMKFVHHDSVLKMSISQ